MLIDQIKHLDIFREISQKDHKVINAICHDADYGKGEVIFEVDQPPKFLFFVLEGKLRLTFPDNNSIEIGPDEYIGEIGLLNGNFRLGELTAINKTKVIKLCGTSLFNAEQMPPYIALNLTKKMGENVTNYFRSMQHFTSSELIGQGESDNVEFKSSIRWNFRTNKKDKEIEHVIIKSIAAFLNTKGGHLFVGVDDSGDVIGLTHDNFLNNDKLLLHVSTIIKERISPNHMKFISLRLEHINGVEFLRIDCTKAHFAAYVKHNDSEKFFIRAGPSSTALKLSTAVSYIKENFASS